MRVCEHACACAVRDAWERAKTYTNVGYVESLNYVLTCLRRHVLCASSVLTLAGPSQTYNSLLES